MHATRVPSFLPVALLVLGSGCQARPPADPQRVARSQAALTGDTVQARLWRTAAERPASQSQPVRPVDTVVTSRVRVQTPSRQVSGQAVTFPAEMRGGLRVDAMPDLPGGSYVGAARVVQASGERVELDLAGGLRLGLLARARGGPLRLAANEEVQLEIRIRAEPADRQRIVALRSRDGDGIVSILETGTKPVSVSIRLFGLVARQVGNAERGTMPVEVQAGGERRTLTQGQVIDLASAGLTVGLIGSTALTGGDRFQAEGNPYAIDLIAWRRQ